jgi:hypothetical protein
LLAVSTPESAPPPPAAPPEGPPQALDDANDLRGHHFKLLIGKPLTWVLIVAAALAGGIAGAAFLQPLLGAVIGVGLVLVGLLVVFAIADSRAADSFFSAYASERGYELGGRSPLPPVVPLMRKGDDRYAERTLSGPIGEGFEAILALYTYEEESRDSKGNKQTNYYRYTVGLVNVPECQAHIPELYAQRKFGFRALEGFEDIFRTKKERVKLESEVLDQRYEIFATKQQDAIWLRRLFSPSFIVWLADSAPQKFAFELVDGNLCCYVSGHKENAAELDGIAAATTAVAKRLREEANETSPQT